MRALISGQAGVAVILDGDRTVSVDVENGCPATRTLHEWPYLLDEADDVYELVDISEQQVISELDFAWRKDRSLHLALIFLDRDTDEETRKESATLLEEFVADDRILRHLLNRLHVAPIPATVDLQGAVKRARNRYPSVAAMLQELSKAQDAITRCRQAWDLLPADLFGSADAKESFGFKAVEQGVFTALASRREVDSVQRSAADAEITRQWKRKIKSLERSLDDRSNIPPTLGAGSASAHGHRVHSQRNIRLAAAAATAILILGAILVKTRPVAAAGFVQLGPSEPGVQVMQVSFSGFQHELYGRTLVPYALRSENKKEAERLFASGEARAIAGKLRDAAEAYGESNASFATVAARVNQAVALFNSSALLQAEQILKSVLIQAENSENKLVKASILTNLGHIARIQGRFDEAEKAYMDALAIDRESGYKAGEAINLNNLGLVLLSRGSVVKSLGKFRDALSTSGEAGIDSCAASSRVNIASVLIAFGRGEEAEQQYLRPASIYLEKQGSALDKADEWTVTGNYLFQTGKYDQALNFFNAAIAFYESLSNKIGESSARLGKANVLGSNLQLDAVLEEYRKAFDLGKSLGDSSLEANALMGIGDYFAVTKHYAEAIVNYQKALDISKKILADGTRCTSLGRIGRVMALMGDQDEALMYYLEELALAVKTGDPYLQAIAHQSRGDIYIALGRTSDALSSLDQATKLLAEIESPLARDVKEHADELRKASQN